MKDRFAMLTLSSQTKLTANARADYNPGVYISKGFYLGQS